MTRYTASQIVGFSQDLSSTTEDMISDGFSSLAKHNWLEHYTRSALRFCCMIATRFTRSIFSDADSATACLNALNHQNRRLKST